jgi:uncharacterized protein
MITLDELKNHPEVKALMKSADANLCAIGYTEHGPRHATVVAHNAYHILKCLGFSQSICDTVLLAGYLHDIGNAINRKTHCQSGGLLAYHILHQLNIDSDTVALIMGAIANHDEVEGEPVSPVAAALIIADKADVHRSRVRSLKEIDFDIHDRVNYAALRSRISVNKPKKTITLDVMINTRISKVMEYFEIFLTRMMASQRAAKILGCEFKLVINHTKFL